MNRSEFATLVPELMCRDPKAAKTFYIDVLGFSLRYDRPESAFCFLGLGGAQIMLCGMHDDWLAGPAEPPFGRGMNLQIEVEDVTALRDSILAADHPIFEDIETAWYRDGEIEHGQREFLVQDLDGYLLRFCEDLGDRSAQTRA